MPWTDAEDRYIVSHRDDGAYLVAEALGRSASAVRHRASRLGVRLAYRKLGRCPVCGIRLVRPGTYAGRHGMCLACWERRKADAIRERRVEQDAVREYDREKHRRGSRR